MRDNYIERELPYTARPKDGDVSRELLLKSSAEMQAWLSSDEAHTELQFCGVEALRFLNDNSQHYNDKGIKARGSYMSSHTPVYVDDIDELLGKSSMFTLVYCQGLMSFLDNMVDRFALDECALDAASFAFDLRTIEVSKEMARRDRNPMFANMPALGLTSLTERFYASSDSTKEMRKKALDMVNLGVWSASEAGTGYQFVAGEVLVYYLDEVLGPFSINHPTLGACHAV